MLQSISFYTVMNGSTMQDIKVGLIGFGTVGQGLAETLHSQENRLTKRTGMKIGIKTIADTRARALPEIGRAHV